MKLRNFRLAPAAAVVTAGLLFVGTAGTAVAAPSVKSASATSSAVIEEAQASWRADGWYRSEHSCRDAGKKGKRQGKWRDYRCKYEERHHGRHDYQWHLYYRR
ncbi:hypothetical protein [Streptomyces sp. I05A-00742]|uniref:hypothetical protein n=1 Tax=Streptomyces sp. I05A-00742 TaxID=2732853 RepID=UPI00148932E1|nr:hypothetical protein [Streptomyces sp. I05A-00742]